MWSKVNKNHNKNNKNNKHNSNNNIQFIIISEGGQLDLNILRVEDDTVQSLN